MFNDLTGLGYGIVFFAILIGVGTIVLFNFGGSVATCTISTCGSAGTFNYTSGVCSNATSNSCGSPTGTAYNNVNYMNTNLGQTGLAGWVPAVIAISVGLLLLGAFLIGGGKKGRY